MTSPATIATLREALSDIERGRCDAALKPPAVRLALQQALRIYDENHATYERLGKQLDRLANCIARAPDSEGGSLRVITRMVPIFHATLYQLRRWIAVHR